MTAYPAWTPASRPGIIPLHPLTFGTILGRSFAALRQNPRVLLGFALCVQTIAYVVVLVAVGGVAWASFSRLDTVQPGSEEFNAIMAGSIAITAVAGIVLGFAAMALSVIVQGVVVTEVSHAVVAEKLSLGALWRQIKPVAWRLVGYSLLLIAVMVAAIAVVGVAIFGLATVAPPAAVVARGAGRRSRSSRVVLWLSTKLFVVPAAIILERATIGIAIGRSWRLTRRRFWSTLGIIVLLNLIFSGIAQVISLPFSFLSTGLTTIIAPTGDPNATAIIALLASALLTQAVVLLVQSVALVVQSTAAALVYIDCRMRHEGLDLDLLTYVERRDAGATALSNPYLRAHRARDGAPRRRSTRRVPMPRPATPYGQAPAYARSARAVSRRLRTRAPATPRRRPYPPAAGYAPPLRTADAAARPAYEQPRAAAAGQSPDAYRAYPPPADSAQPVADRRREDASPEQSATTLGGARPSARMRADRDSPWA